MYSCNSASPHVLFSMSQAPQEARRRRVQAGNIAPRLARVESFSGFLSQLALPVCKCVRSRRCIHVSSAACTPSPPIKSLDFRGFDSSRVFILRGGNSRIR